MTSGDKKAEEKERLQQKEMVEMGKHGDRGKSDSSSRWKTKKKRNKDNETLGRGSERQVLKGGEGGKRKSLQIFKGGVSHEGN